MKANRFAIAFALMLVVITAPVWALSVGDVAPDFTLTDTDGIEHTLSDYQGKVVFLSFIGAT